MKASITQNQNELVIEGELTFDTVAMLYQTFSCQFKKETYYLSMRKVTQCDSASLALITHIARLANNAEATLIINDVPDEMMDIARAYHISDMFDQDNLNNQAS